MRTLNIVAWIAASFGVATGLIALLIAVEHNPQGALINQGSGAVDFRYAVFLFLSWFLIGSIIAGIAISAVWWVMTVMRRLFQK
jgi:hypothetical protein